MLKTDYVNVEMFSKFATRPGCRALLPEITPKAQVALMCRMLFAEGWNDHIAGHITVRQPDGSILTNPWELTWDEVTASDIITLDEKGNILDSDWNTTPAIGLHLQLHEARPDVNVVVHNHPKWSGIWANLQEVPPIYDQAGAYCGLELPIYNEYLGTFEDEGASLTAVESIGDAKWALLAHHGALVLGRDLRQAHLRAATLEWRCRRAYEVRLAGGAQPLADEVVNQVGLPDPNGFPFLWEAMARRELRRDPTVLN